MTTLSSARELVAKSLQKSQQRAKKLYDRKSDKVTYRIGDWALLLIKVLLVILNDESDVRMIPPWPAALLLVKLLLIILNDELNVSMTPPQSALLLVKVLLVVLNHM